MQRSAARHQKTKTLPKTFARNILFLIILFWNHIHKNLNESSPGESCFIESDSTYSRPDTGRRPLYIICRSLCSCPNRLDPGIYEVMFSNFLLKLLKLKYGFKIFSHSNHSDVVSISASLFLIHIVITMMWEVLQQAFSSFP